MGVQERQQDHLCCHCNATPYPSAADCCRAMNFLSSTVAAVPPHHISSSPVLLLSSLFVILFPGFPFHSTDLISYFPFSFFFDSSKTLMFGTLHAKARFKEIKLKCILHNEVFISSLFACVSSKKIKQVKLNEIYTEILQHISCNNHAYVLSITITIIALHLTCKHTVVLTGHKSV